MRLLLAFFLFLPLTLEARSQIQIPIEDRMNTYRYLVDLDGVVHGRAEQKSLKLFVRSLKQRAPETREAIKKLIAQLDPLLPREALLPIVYWRALNPDNKKLAETL